MLENNVIKNENDAFELLKRLSKLPPSSSFGDIKFEGWPHLEIKIVGSDYDSSLKTSQLKALIKLQETIYYQYGLLSGRDHKNLTKEEKDILEIKINVGKGSTDLFIALIKILNAFFSNGVPNPEIALCVIVLALSYSAGHYFDYKKEKIKVAAEQHTEELRSSAEHRQIELIKHSIDQNQEFSSNVLELLTQLLKSTNDSWYTLSRCAPDADDILIGGHSTRHLREIKESHSSKKTPNSYNDSSFEVGKTYNLETTVVGRKNEGKGWYEYEFKDLRTDEILIWEERCNNIANTLDHKIRMAIDSKGKTKVKIRIEVIKSFRRGGGKVHVIEIFGHKPRSFKGH